MSIPLASHNIDDCPPSKFAVLPVPTLIVYKPAFKVTEEVNNNPPPPPPCPLGLPASCVLPPEPPPTKNIFALGNAPVLIFNTPEPVNFKYP